MSITVSALILIVLFVILGVCADMLVTHVRTLGDILKLRLSVLGAVLGAFTTLPELVLGIQTIPLGIVSVSAGNLLGGIMVIFGLVLGVSIILHRNILTDGGGAILAPSLAFILLPLTLASDGSLSTYDGIIVLCFATILFAYLHTREHRTFSIPFSYINQRSVQTSLFYIAGALACILIVSHAIVQITSEILTTIAVSEFVLGLLVFGIGTNLPEFTIALTSWRRKVSELSVSHLISSAMMNMVGLALLAVIAGSVKIITGYGFLILFFSLFATLSLFAIFYKTDKSLRTKEGVALVCMYILFAIGMSMVA